MATKITQGFSITVHTAYHENYSNPADNQYFFTYRITIENKSSGTAQLLRRHWYIFDSHGEKSEVEGEGVLGKQPVIEPGESYTYESSCALQSPIGTMHGTYLMKRLDNDAWFEVEIPRFELVVPHLLC
jgi:ApaG protein